MARKFESLFPTYIYRGRLKSPGRLNSILESEIANLIDRDTLARRRNAKSYPNGYTSFPDNVQLHKSSEPFKNLMSLIVPRVRDFARKLKWDLPTAKIEPLCCWANAMGKGSFHGLHNHPLSMISGVYYITAPKGSAPFVIEDPRINLYMAVPQRCSTAPTREQPRVTLQPKAGELIFFESWLKHEVPIHHSDEPRLSVAFNFGVPSLL